MRIIMDQRMSSRRDPPTALRVVPPVPSSLIVLIPGSSSPSPSPPPSPRSSSLLHTLPHKPRSIRNMKNLTINLPFPNPSSQSLNSPIEPPPSAIDPNPPLRPRRPSVLSLPNPSLSSAIHRQDEDGSPSIPYSTGPIQILPGIWLGSEDNARDWPSLRDRGISAILNVAKEVVSPFDFAHPQPLRPFASAPVTISHPTPSTSTYYPPHPPSGRPPMHYLKLNWSHGQRDLVTDGFPTAMAFVDAALQRNQGILIHCQCGVSRSATLLIALVMRAAATRSPNVPSDVWDLKGMQAAYSFVKDKSRHVGPNMSLIYQLLDYEKALQGGRASPVLSDHASSSNEEDKEWGRRRNAFAQEEGEIDAVQQEAKALDRAMEERVIARKPSSSSLNSGMGMGSAWRSRYGRKRTGSIASIHTTGSVLSEDLVEADEESELLGVGGAFDDALELRRSPSLSSESPGSPTETHAQTPHALKLHGAGSYVTLSAPPSAPVTKLFFNVPRPPTNINFKIAPGKGKRRPPPLGTLPPVPPSPVTPIAVQESKLSPRRRKHLSGKQAPPPLKLQGEPSSIAFPTNTPPSKYPVSALPSQTLFVFPPSPTVTATAMRTPATMTITSNVDNNTYPFPSQTTPRVATSRSHGRTRSFIGLGTSVAPTTAYSRVDARGWVGLE